ncbi:unannotated protein [freshwater metagenome]|uniref:Unannotated protein n=1 Tax=freshwater metagenome TaxID=449393 RepID=A0A6J7FWJ4_9ZZZZ
MCDAIAHLSSHRSKDANSQDNSGNANDATGRECPVRKFHEETLGGGIGFWLVGVPNLPHANNKR